MIVIFERRVGYMSIIISISRDWVLDELRHKPYLCQQPCAKLALAAEAGEQQIRQYQQR